MARDSARHGSDFIRLKPWLSTGCSTTGTGASCTRSNCAALDRPRASIEPNPDTVHWFRAAR